MPDRIAEGGNRPAIAYLIVFYLAYVLAGCFGNGLAIIPGVSITFWPPAGIFAATLLLNQRRSWGWWIATGCAAELTCNLLWFHSPIQWALVYYAANALVAMAVAVFVVPKRGKPFRLDTIEEVFSFVARGAAAAPLISATVISTVDLLRGRHEFIAAWPLVWLGDATGLLVSTPMTIVIINGWRERHRIALPRLLESIALAIVLIATGVLAFKEVLPTAYMLMPPMLWAAARFQMRGAATAVALVAIMTAAFTVQGDGEFVGDAQQMREKFVMLQVFLGISAVSSLLVAALSLQRQEALRRLETINLELEARVAERTSTLRASEERLRLVLAASKAGTWVIDFESGRVECSEQCRSNYGCAANERVTMYSHLQEHIFPGDRAAQEAAMQAAFTNDGIYESEYRIVTHEGAIRWLLSRGYAIRNEDGTHQAMSGINIDITETKQAEQMLRDADQRKDEFLATLAHELRNPLAALSMSIELLNRASTNEAVAANARETMRRQVRHLGGLVDDLLDISRITRDKFVLKRQDVELVSLLERTAEDNRAVCEARRHRLVVSLPDVPLFAHIDPVRLSQVVGNLLNNASKYTPEGGQIRLTARRVGGFAEVDVADNGVGIAAEDLTRVFGLFEQVKHESNLASGGLGIGLSLVKRLVEMHGGSVSAQSPGRGQGSTFSIRIPIIEPPAEAKSTSTRSADASTLATTSPSDGSVSTATGSRLRVLIVDDNADAALALSQMLILSGDDPFVVHDGPEAIEAAKRIEPDLVLLDIGLPTMSGHDVCRAIRRLHRDLPPTIVAVTGWGQEQDRRRTAEAGFDRHWVKPLDLESLKTLLEELRRSRTPVAST